MCCTEPLRPKPFAHGPVSIGVAQQAALKAFIDGRAAVGCCGRAFVAQ
jgi:hypothetical protein